MFGIDLKTILPIVFTTVVAMFVGYKEWRDRSIRKVLGLASNPTSCADHELRLRAIEGKLGEITGHIMAIKVKIGLSFE